jgi:hypothetical protein
MWLRTSPGTYIQVTATKHWSTHQQRVHNLTVAKLHTFYVSGADASVLVHNCDGAVYWVNENAAMGAAAQKYDASAMGSINGKAPALQYYKAGSNTLSQIKFDGIDEVNHVMIDRKLNVTGYPKTARQAQNQSLALQQNGMTGVWEVPNAAVARRVRNVLGGQMITNIKVRIAVP